MRAESEQFAMVAALALSAALFVVTADVIAQAGRPSAGERAMNAGLVDAARLGDVGAMRELLDAGADVNAVVPGDGSPLIAAARRGDMRAVQLLLDRGADVTLEVSGDGNPLIAAARGGHVEIVTLLLNRGADVDHVVAGDENPLIQACETGRLEVVKLLIARGADVNARVLADVYSGNGRVEQERRTPLSVAQREGHAAVVQYLLSVGALD